MDNKNESTLVEEEKRESLLIENNSENSNYQKYYVEKFDELSEEHFRINEIVPLIRTKCDVFILVLLNIFTIGIINLIFTWFPNSQVVGYTKTSLNNAENLGIYCKDGYLYIVEIKKSIIPQTTNKNIKYDIISNSQMSIMFTFKLFTYLYDPKSQKFTSFKFSLNHLSKEEIQNDMNIGLSEIDEEYNRMLFGICDLIVEMGSFFLILFEEFADPFYLFQIYSIVLWSCTGYEKYAIVIAVMSIFSLITGAYETYSSMKNIKNMARYSIPINKYVNVNGEIKVQKDIESSTLVPGDIFEIPEDGSALPCDCILLTGSIIVNEAMLTGESTPIMKTHLPNVKKPFDDVDDSQYFLFAGTKIVQKRQQGEQPVLGLVYNIGFNTVKGNLIRSILFPKEVEVKFKSDSNKYIMFMSVMTIVAFIPCVFFMIKRAENDEEEKAALKGRLIERGLDLFTTTVPPSLPACLSIGTTTAISRLKDYGMMCIRRERMNFAGKINMCVFDKTGTLTEDHLDIEGYLPIHSERNDSPNEISTMKSNHIMKFGEFKRSAIEMANDSYDYYKEKIKNPNKKDKRKELIQLYVECLACCQGITKVNGNLIGDPIDVKMFEGVGWVLNENVENKQNYDPLISTYVRPGKEEDLDDKVNRVQDDDDMIDSLISQHYELGIIKRFDFSSKLQRMSVVTKNVNEPYFKCFVKGSPEKIKELCKPISLPPNFNEELNKCTSQGYRVLALGCKIIKMNFVQCQEMSRTYAESNLTFLGLLVVHNRLKDATPGALKILSEANLRIRMATGDNILTAICVGKKSNLIPSDSVVYSCEFLEDQIKEGEKILQWTTIENFKQEEIGINEVLLSGNMKTMDVTAGNSLTCLVPEMIADNFRQSIYAPQFKKINKSKNEEINTDNNIQKSVTGSQFDEFGNNINVDLSKLPFNEEQQEGIVIAVTGSTFETLYRLNHQYLELLKSDIKDVDLINKYKKFHVVFRLLLKYCSIYARMAPEHKTLLVESLQKESFTVLMCGDGANDCGALKAADVGVSLSTEEASIAAPFTSTVADISSVIKLLREGKAALVTSIQTFKYMMLYSMVQFISVGILMCNGSYLSDWQFMVSDIFIIVPLAFFIPMTEAYHKLTYHQPIGDLLSFPVISSILTQTFIAGVFQFLVLFLVWYRFETQIGYCGDMNEDENPECVENTAVFYVSFIQYLITAVAFCTSKPFKKRIYTNVLLFFYVIAGTIYCEYIIYHVDDFVRYQMKMIAFPDSSQHDMMRLRNPSDPKDDYTESDDENPKFGIEFKYILIIITLINFIVSVVVEQFVIPCVKKCWMKSQIQGMEQTINNQEKEADLNMINEVKNYAAIHKTKKVIKPPPKQQLKFDE